MGRILIKNARAVNENKQFETDMLIENGVINSMDKDISHDNDRVVDF